MNRNNLILRFSFVFFISALASIACARNNAGNEERLCFSPCVVTLHGVISYEVNYGPPGFGDSPETDLKIKVPVLSLGKGISLKGNSSFDAVYNQNKIQVIGGVNISHYIGKKVVITGIIRPAVTAADITKIVIFADDIYTERK